MPQIIQLKCTPKKNKNYPAETASSGHHLITIIEISLSPGISIRISRTKLGTDIHNWFTRN